MNSEQTCRAMFDAIMAGIGSGPCPEPTYKALCTILARFAETQLARIETLKPHLSAN